MPHALLSFAKLPVVVGVLISLFECVYSDSVVDFAGKEITRFPITRNLGGLASGVSDKGWMD